MFCVIQKIKTHKPSTGRPKFIEVQKYSWSDKYCWVYSDERFERPLKPSYRISIHKSYRENGKVKKKQFVICTAGYYEIAENMFGIFDEWYCKKIAMIADELSADIDEIYDMLDKKISPLVEKIQEEYHKTEEYKTDKKNQEVIKEYQKRKSDFAEKYKTDWDEYDKCYDVFGELKNPEYLEKVKEECKFREEYEEKSRSYQEEFYSNYSKYFGNGGSGYHNFISDNHTDEDKEILKQFYRVLSKKYHPDANPDTDTSQQMKLLNQLKNEWGL